MSRFCQCQNNIYSCEKYCKLPTLSGDQHEARVQHEVARAPDGSQRQRRLVPGRDQCHSGHHQALLGPRHCHP